MFVFFRFHHTIVFPLVGIFEHQLVRDGHLIAENTKMAASAVEAATAHPSAVPAISLTGGHWVSHPQRLICELVYDTSIPSHYTLVTHARLLPWAAPGARAGAGATVDASLPRSAQSTAGPIVPAFDPFIFAYLTACCRRYDPVVGTAFGPYQICVQVTLPQTVQGWHIHYRGGPPGLLVLPLLSLIQHLAGTQHTRTRVALAVVGDVPHSTTRPPALLPHQSRLVQAFTDVGSSNMVTSGLDVEFARSDSLEPAVTAHVMHGDLIVAHAVSDGATVAQKKQVRQDECERDGYGHTKRLLWMGDRDGTGRKSTVLHGLEQLRLKRTRNNRSHQHQHQHPHQHGSRPVCEGTAILVTMHSLERWKAHIHLHCPHASIFVWDSRTFASHHILPTLEAEDFILILDHYATSPELFGLSTSFVSSMLLPLQAFPMNPYQQGTPQEGNMVRPFATWTEQTLSATCPHAVALVARCVQFFDPPCQPGSPPPPPPPPSGSSGAVSVMPSSSRGLPVLISDARTSVTPVAVTMHTFPWMMHWTALVVDDAYMDAHWASSLARTPWSADDCVIMQSLGDSGDTPPRALEWFQTQKVLQCPFVQQFAICNVLLTTWKKTGQDIFPTGPSQIVVYHVPLSESEATLASNYHLTDADKRVFPLDLCTLSGRIAPHMTVQEALDEETRQFQYASKNVLQHLPTTPASILSRSTWLSERQQAFDYFCKSLTEHTQSVETSSSGTSSLHPSGRGGAHASSSSVTPRGCGICQEEDMPADVIFDCGHWCCLRCAEVYLLSRMKCAWCHQNLHQGYRICHAPTLCFSLSPKMNAILSCIRSGDRRQSTLVVVQHHNVLMTVHHILQQQSDIEILHVCHRQPMVERSCSCKWKDATRPLTPPRHPVVLVDIHGILPPSSLPSSSSKQAVAPGSGKRLVIKHAEFQSVHLPHFARCGTIVVTQRIGARDLERVLALVVNVSATTLQQQQQQSQRNTTHARPLTTPTLYHFT
jgi:hypothetical protein